MAITRVDYPPNEVEAARSVLLELTHLLGEYRDDIVIVGGWVPELLLSRSSARHIGSLDIDLALNHRTLQGACYRTILQLLLSRGYRQGDQPFMFKRDVRIQDRTIVVQVDLLAGEYQGTGGGRRHQVVQDVRARKVRGCELALEMAAEVTLEGVLPDGGRDSSLVRVASIVPFLVMKGMALHERLKEKDAWDIYFCLQNYPGGLEAVVEEFRAHINHGLVQEGLRKIALKFASSDHVGPRHVADFEELEDPDQRALRQRDAFERVNYLMRELGIAHESGTRMTKGKDRVGYV